MKILLLTTPIRNVPTEFPPVACLSLKKALRKAGYDDVFFYDIDNLRPDEDEIKETIRRYSPDIVGISSVVSTAYAYTKWLAFEIRRMVPKALVVLGGNLAASSEIVLRKTKVDFCVLSEGEVIFTNVVRAVENGARVKSDFVNIKGLIFLGEDGNLINTGYEKQLPKEEVYDFDWEDLEESSRIDHFFPDPVVSPTWGFHLWGSVSDQSAAAIHIHTGKKLGTIVTHKGCVARCTFCHRWDKGVRYIPPEILVERIQFVMEKYDVGFLSLAGENFGSDRKWTEELCRRIKPLNLVWRVGGMRASTVTKELLEMMKDAGCVCVIYGMETGSPKMLKIMEKNLDVKKNFQAMEWTISAGLFTAVQLVIGMPGESPETIRETIKFTEWALTLNPGQNPNNVSINYAQALPGTPLYEYGRMKGLIGKTLDEEEKYLTDISDKNASGALDTLNFTEFPKLICDTWQALIQIETNYAYIQRFGLDHYQDIVLKYAGVYAKKAGESGYFNEPQRTMEKISKDSVSVTFEGGVDQRELGQGKFPPLWRLFLQNKWKQITIFYPVFSYRIRRFLVLACLLRVYKQRGGSYGWSCIKEYCAFQWNGLLRRNEGDVPYESLRKITDPLLQIQGDPAMVELRRGR